MSRRPIDLRQVREDAGNAFIEFQPACCSQLQCPAHAARGEALELDLATGRVTRTLATVVAVGEGVVLETADGVEALYCSGLPERLELMRIPDELLAKPRLSVRLAAGEAGPRTVKVSYLAHGFAWSPTTSRT